MLFKRNDVLELFELLLLVWWLSLRQIFNLVKTPLPLKVSHQQAPKTTSITTIAATTVAGAGPTTITIAATTATATAATATWVDTDDVLGLVPIMWKYMKQ